MSERDDALRDITQHIRSECDLRTTPEGWAALKEIFDETLGPFLDRNPAPQYWGNKRFRHVILRVVEDVIWEAQRAEKDPPDPARAVTEDDIRGKYQEVFDSYEGTCRKLIQDLRRAKFSKEGQICGELSKNRETAHSR